jgi:hypothetical protein
MDFLKSFLEWIAQFLGQTPKTTVRTDEPLQVISPKVFVINFDPFVDEQGTRLTTKMGWQSADALIAAFVAEMEEVSYGLVKYQVEPANRVDVDAIPHKTDGFRYTPAAYLAMLQDEKTHHEPDGVDYWKIVKEYGLIQKVMSGQIDEVWLFGGPYFGFWESHMVGKGAIWCNSAPLANSEHCTRRFVIMGFNYQRGVGEMLHDIGHRMEAIMAHVYGSVRTLDNAYRAIRSPVDPQQFAAPKNDFERFLLYDKIAPGRAEVGLVHMPPNAEKDYDWRNPRQVSSSCDDWLTFPDLPGTRRMVSCQDWESRDASHGHIQWWLKHIPHAPGGKNGIANNWWKYTIQVDQPWRGR